MARVILGKYKGIEVPVGLTGKEKEEYVIQKIVEKSTVKVPEANINDRARRMAEEYALRLSQQGLSIEQYYEVAHTDEKALVNQMKELAKKHLKGQMVLETIARKEGITATNEDYEKEIENMTIRYPLGQDEIRSLMSGSEEVRLRNEIAVKKAMDFVVEHAVTAVSNKEPITG